MRPRSDGGFALIDLLFVVAVIGILCSISVPQLVAARNSASGSSAVASLRLINSAQLSFAITCGRGFFAPNLSTLGTAPPGSPQAFLPEGLALSDSVERSGYLIQVAATADAGAPASCNGVPAGQLAQAYKAGADAMGAGNPRSFATNANGTIWENPTPFFALMPETGEPPVGFALSR